MDGKATIPKGHEYSGWGEVTATQQAHWNPGTEHHYQYIFTITNTSNANIQGWEIIMNIPQDALLSSASDANVRISNGRAIIIDNGSDAMIAPSATCKPFIEFTTTEANFEVTFLQLNGIQMNLSGQTVEATAIYINEEDLTMFPNQTTDLTVRYEPYNGTGTIAWSSSNPAVAAVDPATGVVTSVAPGECIITATCGTLTDTCNVTVESDIVQSTSLEIHLTAGNSWSTGNGFFNVQYTVHIKNISDQPISGWTCDLVLPAGSGYNSGWNATVTNTSGSTFHVVGSNNTIAPGATSSDTGMILIVPSTTYIPIPTNITP